MRMIQQAGAGLAAPQRIRPAFIAVATVLLSVAAYFSVQAIVGHRVAAEQAALQRLAHRVSEAVDAKVREELGRITVLAASETLRVRDFEAFYRESKAFADTLSRPVVLHDLARNQQIFNTAVPYGIPLQGAARFVPEVHAELMHETRQFVSSVFYAPLAQRHMVAVALPIEENGRVAFLLGVPIELDAIHKLLAQPEFDQAAIRVVVDRNSAVVARSVGHAEFAARKVPSDINVRAPGRAGRFSGVSMQGARINLAYARSELTGWVSLAAVPESILKTDSRWPGIAAALSVALLAAALFLSQLLRADFRRGRSAAR